MRQIVLSGCHDGYFPLSALAAFGLLHVLTDANTEGELPRLSWQRTPRWTPVLHTCFTVEEVLERLRMAMERDKESPVLGVLARQKVSPTVFHDVLASCQATEFEVFCTALGCEWPQKKDGGLYTTPFVMTSGNQNWYSAILQTATYCAAHAPSVIEEVLFGPWRYQDPLHPLGWDPSQKHEHALMAKAPTDLAKQSKSMAGATWLAAHALPLFPCIGERRGMQTVGMIDAQFVIPVWTAAWSLNALRMIYCSPTLSPHVRQERIQELKARGVAAVYRAQRLPVGKYYAIFAPAEVIWSGEG